MSLLEDDTTSGSPRVLMDRPGPQNLIVADWSAQSVQGSQRLRNEDSWGQLGPIFVVADGMGGLDAGDIASSMATRSLVSEWFTNDENNPVDVLHAVNTRVRQELRDHQSGGTTLSSVRIAHDHATVMQVGDSRIYRLRDGQAELLTREHNLRTELLAAGVVPRNSLNFGPLRALTSYLGMKNEDLQIDVRSVALRDGDLLLLCSDGVFEQLTPRQFTDIARRGETEGAADVAQALTTGVRADDATAVVLKIGRASQPLPTEH